MLRYSLLIAILAGQCDAAAPALMPLPVKADPVAGRLVIDSTFTVGADACSDPRMDSAASRLTAQIARQTGVPALAGIRRNLDAMALVKLNVFHWHLSDDQGFRAESKRYPKLQELGSDGRYYTQDEIRQVVQYASDRGIRVVPEFDIPAHSTSWLV